MRPADRDSPREGGQTLGDVAFERLRQDIVRGALDPGEKLRFDFLRKRYGLNVGALREGLSRLAAQGLVLSRSQRGFFVAPISERDLADVTALRCAVDSLGLRLAMERGGMSWEKQVVSALYELIRTPRRRPDKPAEPNEAWISKHRAFHHALISGCESPAILQIHTALFDRSERYRRLSFRLRASNRDWSHEHRALADAALNRSAEACRLLERHIVGVSRRLGQARRARRPGRR